MRSTDNDSEKEQWSKIDALTVVVNKIVGGLILLSVCSVGFSAIVFNRLNDIITLRERMAVVESQNNNLQKNIDEIKQIVKLKYLAKK